MSIGVSEASLSDIAAVTNRNDGYGNGDGMWGNNAWWIVILLIFGWTTRSLPGKLIKA